MHSADRNPWVAVAEEQKRTIDKTRPPWARSALPSRISGGRAARISQSAGRIFCKRVGERAQRDPDVPAAALLAPDCRWNNLISAIGTYISGAELDRVSARDFDNYDDTGVNWRIVEGYGATIAKCGESLPAILDCPVQRIDHQGNRLKIETPQGAIIADQAIVTLPTSVLADTEQLFAPALPDKIEAARGLPLGLADKLFLSLEGAEEFDKDSRLFGATDQSATATYHMRPFGRPLIEAYFGGRLAADLEAGGASAFFEFAVSELARKLGNDFARQGETNSCSSLGRRSICARFIFICIAWQGGLPRHARCACERPPVLRRRGLLARRFFDRAWGLDHRRHCRRSGDFCVAQECDKTRQQWFHRDALDIVTHSQ